MNICFASGERRTKNAALGALRNFAEIFAPPPDDIDILVMEGNCDISSFVGCNIDTCIFQSGNAMKVTELKNVNSAISCGMNGLDTVTFSSISEDEALVCIRRWIVFKGKYYYPCEFKTSFNKRLGIYSNLVISLLNYLADNENEEYEEI